MGFDGTNNFPEGTKRKDVVEFLELLGYTKHFEKNVWYFFKDDNYKFITGIFATIDDEDNQISVHTRTTVWRSKADSDYHNFTLKQLKKRFGGDFSSDYGKGRYFRPPDIERTNAEAGCYRAYSNFHNNEARVSIYIYNRDIKFEPKLTSELIRDYPFIAEIHPLALSNNIVVPFIVSSIEDYFKSTYIALLKYSDKKLSVLKNSRILPEDLLSISNNEMSVETAITKTMSFQNINKINSYFRDLDTRLDISGTLKRPYRRRRKSLYDTLNEIFERRHLLIHRNIVTANYTTDEVIKDIENVRVAIKRVYKKIIDTYSWQDESY